MTEFHLTGCLTTRQIMQCQTQQPRDFNMFTNTARYHNKDLCWKSPTRIWSKIDNFVICSKNWAIKFVAVSIQVNQQLNASLAVDGKSLHVDLVDVG